MQTALFKDPVHIAQYTLFIWL